MRKAFTLLEVLLAIGLVAALSGGVFSFMWQLGAQKTAIVERAQDGQAADVLLERIEADLVAAVASDSGGGSGIVGTSTSMRILSRGVLLPIKAGDQAWADGDLRGAEYSGTGGVLTARRWDAHRDRDGRSGESETLSKHLAALRIRYYDGTQWVDSFDSKSVGGLPVAIEVSLWFGRAEPDSGVAKAEPPVSEPVPDSPLDSDGNPLASDAAPPDVAPRSRESERPQVPPDRTRIMVVPDGPITAWKESR